MPLRAAVAGIAMGLISGEVDGKTEYVALTDILGAEDAFGDMDFKVAGTREFVTALQLDTKLDGIPAEVLASALNQAKDARYAILDVMAEAIDEPEEMSLHAPRIITVKIPVDKIGEVIGPKGKVINQIQDDTGAQSVDRGRRHHLHRCHQRRVGRGRPPGRQRDRQPDHAGGRRALPGHGREDDQLRCVRLAAPGQGRPAAHQQAASASPVASASRPSRTSSPSARRSRSRSREIDDRGKLSLVPVVEDSESADDSEDSAEGSA